MKSALFDADEAKRRLYLRGMHGRSLAKAVGVSEASVSYYLRGLREPSAPVFLRICQALEAKPEELSLGKGAAPASESNSPERAA
jgi:transcriptional regulator with XRE-family HTH domain